ncbi:S-layer homology domain-containing protein [Leptolyngbya sp. FACHB-321]|uniref:S-layer homology domain-containing protein n=1 Tax=Leptolyngbya sp. FACHB-321 TaxID=2692807 RepID=UPI0019907735|nr:S-layer homology domain-containing protein [Leptolyngbya sp. FACHB-321]
MPKVLIYSTLTTLACYQGYVTFFTNADKPDDESASKAAKDGAKSEQPNTNIPDTIAVPETIMTDGLKLRLNVPATSPRQLAANRSAAARGGLPTVNVPPKMRSLPTRSAARPVVDSTAMQNVPEMTLPETIATEQSKPDAIDQNRPNASVTQSLPFTSVNTSLSDVQGHWAESYIESLAAKGIVRGFRDGSFRPNERVTARQFDLMAQKAFTASPVSYGDLQQLHSDRLPTRADAAALIYQTLAKETSAPLTMAVQVKGAVPRPGIYAIANGSRIDAPSDAGLPTVSRAIQRAGGTLDGADLRQVEIHRIDESSARQVINVNVQQLLQSGDRSRDIVLQQGDKLVIPTAATAASNQTPSLLAPPERSARIMESTK